jgi:Mg2+ and Co2+ transporter CorA
MKAKINYNVAPNIPQRLESSRRLGYPLILVVMVAVGIAMVAYFRKKRWL